MAFEPGYTKHSLFSRRVNFAALLQRSTGSALRQWPAWVTLLALGGVWQILGAGSAVFPPPSKIAQAFWRTRDLLPAHIRATLIETLYGTIIGVSLGASVAIVMFSIPFLRRALHPILVASQTIPVQILSPVLVLWFGFGLLPKVIVVAMVVFFPVAVSTASGLESADQEMLEMVRSLGAGRRQEFRFLLGPAALPAALSGLRISLTYAVAAAAISESIGASEGLGLYIARSQRAFRYDQVFVGVFVVTLLSIAFFSIVHVLDRVLCPWRHLSSVERTPPSPVPVAPVLTPTTAVPVSPTNMENSQ